ncbi:MAG TPA: LytR C-terminal domain-containing protein [Ignavibacteria bacterium]|nr:LytR C-terminal domain-containing protein [Ignavibacteria bacterium]
MKEETKKNVLNYILNIAIIILFGVCAYLGFSLIMNANSGKDIPPQQKLSDTTKVKTNQPNLTVQLEVLNGTSQSGVAGIFTDFLRKQGFDVVDYGNYQSNDEPKTLIIDRTGNNLKCKKIAASLGVNEKNIIQQINPELYIDASVVIGKDYKELKPFTEK